MRIAILKLFFSVKIGEDTGPEYGQDAGGDDCKAAHSALYFTEFNGLACSNCMGRGAECQPACDTVFNVEPFQYPLTRSLR